MTFAGSNKVLGMVPISHVLPAAWLRVARERERERVSVC